MARCTRRRAARRAKCFEMPGTATTHPALVESAELGGSGLELGARASWKLEMRVWVGENSQGPMEGWSLPLGGVPPMWWPSRPWVRRRRRPWREARGGGPRQGRDTHGTHNPEMLQHRDAMRRASGNAAAALSPCARASGQGSRVISPDGAASSRRVDTSSALRNAQGDANVDPLTGLPFVHGMASHGQRPHTACSSLRRRQAGGTYNL